MTSQNPQDTPAPARTSIGLPPFFRPFSTPEWQCMSIFITADGLKAALSWNAERFGEGALEGVAAAHADQLASLEDRHLADLSDAVQSVAADKDRELKIALQSKRAELDAAHAAALAGALRERDDAHITDLEAARREAEVDRLACARELEVALAENHATDLARAEASHQDRARAQEAAQKAALREHHDVALVEAVDRHVEQLAAIDALHNDRSTLTNTNTQSGEGIFSAGLLKLTSCRQKDPRARGAERMTESNCTTIHVDPTIIEGLPKAFQTG